MNSVYFNSDIRLKNNDKVSLVLDGSVPGLVLYPVQNGSWDIIDSIKETLTNKGFYTKTYNQNECDFSRITDFVSENPLLVVILDGLNPNIVFAYGYFKANNRFIFPIFNNKDIKNGNRDDKLFEFDKYVSFDLGNTSPEELNAGLKNVLNQYLDNNTKSIVKDYADIVVRESEINNEQLRSEVKNLVIKVIGFQMALDKPDIQTLNDIYTRIQELESQHGVTFPKKIYSLLPFNYLSLFESGDLSTLELKKSIKNINKLSEKIYETEGNNFDILLLKKRLADALTLSSVYDDRIDNCRNSAGYLEQLAEKLEPQQYSLYNAKVLNNLGINHLLIYESTGDTKDLEKAINNFENAVNISGKDRFPLEFGKFQRNLGIGYQRKASLLSHHELFQKSIDCFREYKDIYTEDIFPDNYYDSIILLGNSFRDLGSLVNNSEYIDDSLDLFDNAEGFFDERSHPYENARISREKALVFSILYDLTGDDNYFNDSKENYYSSLKYFNLADYPFRYATIISELADLYFRSARSSNSPEILEKSVSLLEEALTLITFDENPAVYAVTQSKLGDCYSELASGNKEEEPYLRAQESYEQALRVYTGDSSPADFIKLKEKLAKAYGDLACLNGSRDFFTKAVDSYNECIGLLDAGKDRSLIISIFNDMGDLYSSLASANNDESTFQNMLESYNNALELIDKDKYPEEFLKTMRNIGLACSNLGRISSEERLIRDGIQSFTDAVDFCDKEEFPDQYALLNYELAESLGFLYERVGEREDLRDQIKYLSESLKLYDFETTPEFYGLVSRKLGICFRTDFLEFDTKDLDNFNKTIQFFRNSLKYFTKEQFPEEYGEISREIADMYAFVSKDTFDSEKIKKSVDVYRDALHTINAEENPVEYGLILNNIGNQLRELAEIENKLENCDNAIRDLVRASELTAKGPDKIIHKTIINNLASAHITLAEASETVENANKAIKYLKEVLSQLDKDQYPELYSYASNNMGNALVLLSSRIVVEDESLIENFNNALGIYDPETNSREYASILSNAAFAYCSMTEAQGFIENHKKAIEMYSEALEIFSSGSAGRSFSLICNNLANAYTEVGWKEQPGDNCTEALKYLDRSLNNVKLNDGHFVSVINNNLGNVYYELAADTENNDSHKNIEKAIGYLRNAMSNCSKQNDPDYYSVLCGNYAAAIKYSSDLKKHNSEIEKQLDLYNEALHFYRETDFPSEYGAIKYENGILLNEYAHMTADPDKFVESIKCFIDSAKVYTRSSAPLYHATVCYALGSSYLELAKDRDPEENCKHAMDYTVESESVFIPGEFPLQYAVCRLQEAEICRLFSQKSPEREYLVRTLEAYRDSLNYFKPDMYPEQHRIICNNVHDIFKSMSESGMSTDDPEESINSLTKLKQIFSGDQFPREYFLIQKEIAGRYEELSNVKDAEDNLESAIKSYVEIVQLPIAREDRKEETEILGKLGNCYYILGRSRNDPQYLDDAVDSFNRSIEYYKTFGNNDRIQELLEKKGDCYELKSDIRSSRNDHTGALTELDMAIDIFKELKDSKKINDLSYKKANLLYIQARESNETEKFKESARIFDSLANTEKEEHSNYEVCELHEILGDIFKDLSAIKDREDNLITSSHHYIKALEYSTAGESEDKTFKLNKKTGEINRTIAEEFYNRNDFENAIKYYMNSVKYLDSHLDPGIYSEIKAKLVDSYRNLGSLQLEADTDSAIELYKSALEISEESTDNQRTAEIRKDLALMYLEEGKNSNNPDYIRIALDNFRSCLDYYTSERNAEEYSNINILISGCYRTLSESGDLVENLKNCINPLEKVLDTIDQDSSPEKFHEISASIADIYMKLGDESAEREENDAAKDFYLGALERSSPEYSPESYSYLNYRTAFLIYNNGIDNREGAESARKHFLKSLEFYNSTDHREKYLSILPALANTEFKLFELTSDTEHILNAVNEYEKYFKQDSTEPEKQIIQNYRSALITTSDISSSRGDYDDAIKKLERYLELAEEGEDQDKVADIRKKIGDLSLSVYVKKGDERKLGSALDYYKGLVDIYSSRESKGELASVYKGLFLVCIENFKNNHDEFGSITEILDYGEKALQLFNREDSDDEMNEVKRNLNDLKEIIINFRGSDTTEKVNSLTGIHELFKKYFDPVESNAFNYEIADIYYKYAQENDDPGMYSSALEYFIKYNDNNRITEDDPEYGSFNFRLFNIYTKLFENEPDINNGENALNHYRIFRNSGHDPEDIVNGDIEDVIYRICLNIADIANGEGDHKKALDILNTAYNLCRNDITDSTEFRIRLAYTKTRTATGSDADHVTEAIECCDSLIDVQDLDDIDRAAVKLDLGDLYLRLYNIEKNEYSLRRSLGYLKDACEFYSGEAQDDRKKIIEEKIERIRDMLAEMGSFEDTRTALEYNLKQLDEADNEKPYELAELYEKIGDIYLQLYKEDNSGTENLDHSIDYLIKCSEIFGKLDPQLQQKVNLKLRDSYLSKLAINKDDVMWNRLELLEKIHSLGPLDDSLIYCNTCREAGDLLFEEGQKTSDHSYLEKSYSFYSEYISRSNYGSDNDESAQIKINMALICLRLGDNCNDTGMIMECLEYIGESYEYYRSSGEGNRLQEIRNLKAELTLKLAANQEDPDLKLNIYEGFLTDATFINNDLSSEISMSAADIYKDYYSAEGESEHFDRAVELYRHAEEFYDREGRNSITGEIRRKINDIIRSSLSLNEDDAPDTKISKLSELMSIFHDENNFNDYLKTGYQLALVYMKTGKDNNDNEKLLKSLLLLEDLIHNEQIDHTATEFLEVVKSAAEMSGYLSDGNESDLLLKSIKYNKEVIDLYKNNRPFEDPSEFKTAIKERLVELLRLDIRNEGLSKACSGYRDNFELAEDVFSEDEKASIHLIAVQTVMELYKDEEIKTVLVFLDKIRSLVEANGNTEIITTVDDFLFNTHIKIASLSLDSGEYHDAVEHFTKAKDIVDKTDDAARSREVLFSLGSVYEVLWKQDGNYKNLNKALKYLESFIRREDTESDEKSSTARDKLNDLKLEKAVILSDSGKFTESLDIINDLLNKAEREDEPAIYYRLIRTKADVHLNIVQNENHEPDNDSISQALELFDQAVEFYTNDKFPYEHADISKKLEFLNTFMSAESEESGVEEVELITEEAEESIEPVEPVLKNPAETSGGPVEDTDHQEMITNYENILKKLKVEDSPENYADTCWKIARSYHKLAKDTGDKKKYAASLKSYQNALNIFDFIEYPEKNASISREIGDIYKFQAFQNNDIKMFKQLIRYYDDSLKYYKYNDFPEDYSLLTRDIAYAQTRIAELSGDVKKYRESAENYKNVLKFFNRDTHPVEYAEINMRLGISNSIIAGFESADETMKNAIEAFNNSLEVYKTGEDNDKVAVITKYLGIAYSALADKENSAEFLKKSAENYCISAELFAGNDNLNEFGFVSKSLGAVYSSLAREENQGDNLKNSINAYEDALSFYTLENSPQEFASINNHLGSLYRSLSEIENVSHNCSRSVECFEQVLRVYNRNENPMEYAATLNNLGVAYRTLADAENKVQNCKRAIDSYKKALLIYTFKDFPVQFASTQNNIGSAYGTLAEEENKAENCKKAVKAYEEALKVRTIQEMPVQFAATQNNLGVAYRMLSEAEDKARNCLMAIKSYEGSLVVYSPEKFPLQYATTQNNIAGAYSTLAEVEERKKNCDLAIECYREAQKVFTQDTYTDIYEMIEDSINYLLKFGKKEQ